MCKCDKDGKPIKNTFKDLEGDFSGLRYSKLVGVNEIGDVKNIYEETYVEGDKIRTYIPSEVKNNATTLSLTLYFFGIDRQRVFDEFNEYIRQGYTKYWDTARNKGFVFYIKDSIKISEEKWYGGKPYFSVTYKLRNLHGQTITVK